MATSQNGFPVYESYGGPLVTNPIPGTSGIKFLGGLSPAADIILRYVGSRWHHEVEPITGPETTTGQWGYNYRAIRGQDSGFSNHASGTAVDINSAAHPLGTRTLSQGKLAAIQRISNDLEGVVRFGAFYSGRPDEMHAELNASSIACAAMTARIKAGQVPNVPAELLDRPPGPAGPRKYPLWRGSSFGVKGAKKPLGTILIRTGYESGAIGVRVRSYIRAIQTRLGLAADGYYGPATERAVKTFQRTAGKGIKITGVVGPSTWKALNIR